VAANKYLPNDAKPSDLLQLNFNLFSDNDTQNAAHAARNWLLVKAELETRFPWLRKAAIMCDGAKSYNSPLSTAWLAQPVGADKIRVTDVVHNEPGHGGNVSDSNGATVGSEIHKAARATAPTPVKPKLMAADAARAAQNSKLLGQVNRLVVHPADEPVKADGTQQLSCGSMDVLHKELDGEGGVVARNFYRMGNGRHLGADELARHLGVTAISGGASSSSSSSSSSGGAELLPAAFDAGFAASGVLEREMAKVVILPRLARARDEARLEKAAEKRLTMLADAAARMAAPQLPSRSTQQRAKAAGRGAQLPKVTLESAKDRMKVAVENCHVDFAVGTSQRLPASPRDGISRVRRPAAEEVALIFGITEDNGWVEEPGATGYWVRLPLPVPRPGTMHRDRFHGADGLLPKGGMKEVQEEWLRARVPLHINCKTHKQAHKRGQYPHVSVAMAAALGFGLFVGAEQIKNWVQKQRDAYNSSASANREEAVRAAEGLAEAEAQ
jgi:hypothetical protein